MCRICSPSRPALRTISDPFQSNSLKSLRNRHTTRSKLTLGKGMSLCGKKVAQSKLSMRPNKKSNIREKGFQCDICSLILSDKSKVERHKRTKHCNEKPFQCQVCGFATKRADYLNIHKRRYCKGWKYSVFFSRAIPSRSNGQSRTIRIVASSYITKDKFKMKTFSRGIYFYRC